LAALYLDNTVKPLKKRNKEKLKSGFPLGKNNSKNIDFTIKRK